jgi:hypothetical protein
MGVASNEPELPGGRYALVLVALLTSYMVTAFVTGRAAAWVSTVLYTATVLLALRTSGLHRDASRVLRLILFAGTIAAVGLLAASTEITNGLADIWFALLLLVTIAIVVRRVISDRVVTLQTVLGSLSAYMMIGLMFAAIYAAIEHLVTQPFFVNMEPANAATVQYFSFTTLTTVGYGDFTAAANAGRAVATLEALAGQIFLGTFVARLVASFMPRHPVENGDVD